LEQVGGIDPDLIAFKPEAAFDSWITVGVTNGDTSKLGVIGLQEAEWEKGREPLEVTNGAVFWMNPADGPKRTDTPVVVAQLTIRQDSRPGAFAAINIAGQASMDTGQLAPKLKDFYAKNIRFELSGHLIPTPSKGGDEAIQGGLNPCRVFTADAVRTAIAEPSTPTSSSHHHHDKHAMKKRGYHEMHGSQHHSQDHSDLLTNTRDFVQGHHSPPHTQAGYRSFSAHTQRAHSSVATPANNQHGAHSMNQQPTADRTFVNGQPPLQSTGTGDNAVAHAVQLTLDQRTRTMSGLEEQWIVAAAICCVACLACHRRCSRSIFASTNGRLPLPKTEGID
jgi:hypothetical protein